MWPVESVQGVVVEGPASKQGQSSLKRLRAFLRARPDSEHEVAINRIAFNIVVFLYWTAAILLGSSSARDTFESMLPISLCYSFAAVLLFVHLLISPGVSHPRRCIAMLLDLSVLSWTLYAGEEAGALLSPIYLWAVLGYGFRFGLRYMAAAAVCAVGGFVCVLLWTPFWAAHTSLGVGLALGLIIIPAYAATLVRKLSAATRAAEAANRSKSMFLASVSHELRTPLNAIIGLSDLLSDSALESEQADMVRTIGRSGRSLSSLINSILDVARMEIGNQRIKTDEVDVFALLADIRDMLAVQANVKALRICVHVEPGTPQRVVFNQGHLEEILVNLGGNAVKFTQEGYVQICVSLIASSADGVRLRFEVCDTGIGISENARERIFERFSQADETIIDQYGGTGLGLAIAKQLVECNGGKIGVDSSPGAGSAFWFEFPCKRREDAPRDSSDYPVVLISADRRIQETFAGACKQLEFFDVMSEAFEACESRLQSPSKKPVVVLDEQSIGLESHAAIARWMAQSIASQWPLVWLKQGTLNAADPSVLSMFCTSIDRPLSADNIRAAVSVARSICVREPHARAEAPQVRAPLDILVAEDNRTNQLVIRKILENAGHRVAIAENGEQALERLGAKRFDLVFMDVNMPVLNGIETAKLARFIELDAEKVPIVALTADATHQTHERCLEAGMDDCLTKPIDQQRLLAWLAAFQDTIAAKLLAAPARTPDVNESAVEPIAREAPQSVDQRTLRDLEQLGGKDFVDQIVAQFVEDAACVLKELSRAVSTGDAYAFREQAHALRSCAANVGARKVYNLCLEWRDIDVSEIAMRGEAHMRELENEFELARAALIRN